MADTVGSEPRSVSRRRRSRDTGTKLTVAELLALHGGSGTTSTTSTTSTPSTRATHATPVEDPVVDDELPTPRRVPRPPDPADRTDQLILGGPELGDTPTELVPRIPEPKTGSPAAAATPEAATPADDHPEDAPDDDVLALRARRIDESLVRLTAIHAGLGASTTARVSGSRSKRSAGPDDDPPGAGSSTATAAGRPGPLVRLGRAAMFGLAGVLFVTTGVGWGAKNSLESELRSVAALDPNSDSIVDKAGQYGDENYLLVGSDSRAGFDGGSDSDRVGSASAVPGARADTVMLAHIPAKRDRVVLVSFPRDLEVDRPGCDRWDPVKADYPGGTAPAQRDVKLNTAYEIGGPRCVTKVIQKISGLSVNHFTAIDFAGFKDMVDSVAGVPICVDRPVVDSVLGRVVPVAGQTVLGGDQALAFVRARHVQGDPTSDYGRIQRQQRFLSALLRKGLSEQVLLNPTKLRAFITAFGSHTLSDNAGLDELTTLGGSLRDIDPAEVTFVTVPTQGEPNSAGNEVLRKADTDALFGAIRADEQLPGEAASSSAEQARMLGPSNTTAPDRVSLSVRNGSEESGLANKVADNLRSVGFTVSGVGDADNSPQTVIRYSPDRAEHAATVAAAVPGAITKDVTGPAGLLELVLGDGFDGEIRAPATADGSVALPAGVNTVNAADSSCH